ncbi:MAG: hypothetical protein HY865_09335 [Chloroflexi bacterium]|nr:hypothetical protein [Chloroflexota bacterium]
MRKLLFLIGLAAIIVLSGCEPKEVEITCRPPKKDFSEADLVGIWWAGYVSSPKVNDYLEIRADGTYKQIIYIEHAEIPSVYYESDWLPWRVEYFSDGILYLHMEGLRLCAHTQDASCDKAGGGEKDWEAFNENEWYDSCRDTWLLQKNEGILRVLGATYDDWTNDGIELSALTVNALDSWVYRLQKTGFTSPTALP